MISLREALVVEDQADACEWLCNAVRRAFPSVEVVAVGSVADARAALANTVPQLALVDLGLPDGSGIQLIDTLNRDHPETVVVVSTVFEDDGHLFAALRAGAQGYLLKDEPRERLAELLEGIVEGRPPLSPTIARRLLDYFHAPDTARQENLTERERDVLTLLAKGFTVRKVAELLEISHNTAAGYVKTIYRKLNVSNRAQATLTASRLGLISDDAD